MGILDRKEREKEIRRQQIIVAARRVFSGKGFSKSTMENIAVAAELSTGTIYLYFRNKEELYASILSGVGLSEIGKKVIHEEKNCLNMNLSLAYEIFSRGVSKGKPAAVP